MALQVCATFELLEFLFDALALLLKVVKTPLDGLPDDCNT
jgi:hypothetical protein